MIKALSVIAIILAAALFTLDTNPAPDQQLLFGASTQDVIPNATAAEANGSCTTANAHTAMDDDPDSGGDASLCTASSNTADHDIRLNFNTPTPDGDPISTATDAQVFALLAVNSQPSASGDPTVALDLYCNGVLVEAGADQAVGDSLVVITEAFTFNTTSCASDGSDVEVLVDCTARNVGGTGNDASCNYEAVEWEATTASVAVPVIERQHEVWFD